MTSATFAEEPNSTAFISSTKAEIDALLYKAQQGDSASFQAIITKADQDDPQALFRLGVSYLYGDSVTKDSAKAIEYLQKAAKAGSAQAGCDLGLAFAKGEDVPRNIETSMHWFEWSAKRGDADAQGYLGTFYVYGVNGFQQDLSQAYMWLSLSVTQGNTSNPLTNLNNQLLAKVKSQLSPEQITEAEKLARDWKPVVATTTPGR